MGDRMDNKYAESQIDNITAGRKLGYIVGVIEQESYEIKRKALEKEEKEKKELDKCVLLLTATTEEIMEKFDISEQEVDNMEIEIPIGDDGDHRKAYLERRSKEISKSGKQYGIFD